MTDAFEERDGELAAEVFAEFVESGGEIGVFELGGMEVEPNAPKEGQNSFCVGRWKESGVAGVERIEGDADGDGFAMANGEVGELFDLVSGPMAEIEWAG